MLSIEGYDAAQSAIPFARACAGCAFLRGFTWARPDLAATAANIAQAIGIDHAYLFHPVSPGRQKYDNRTRRKSCRQSDEGYAVETVEDRDGGDRVVGHLSNEVDHAER